MKAAQVDDVRCHTGIYGSPVSHSVSPLCHKSIFESLGLPRHRYGAYECSDVTAPGNAWQTNIVKPETMGTCLTMPLKLQVIPYLDKLTDRATDIGSVNTTYFVEGVGHVGDNTDPEGVRMVLLSALTGKLSPYDSSVPVTFSMGAAAGFVVGGGGAARSVIYAMTKLGLSPLYIVNRDRTEIDVLLKQFANVDLRPLYTPKEAEWALASLQRQDIKLCVGVGAIPSFEPQTAEEKQLYDTATLLFKQAGPAKQDTQTAVPSEGDHLLIPHRPIFLDMAYKPRMTILRSIGEEHGWNTLCGVEVVAELCFVQAHIWTGLEVSSEAREKVRRLVREAV